MHLNEVFVVQHVHDLGGSEDTKLIGVYSSRALADHAVGRMRGLPGFRDHPDGFHIDSYRLDQDHWSEGFSSLTTIYVELEDEGVRVWRPVQAEHIADDRYRIATLNENSETEQWQFSSGEIVVCREQSFDGGSTGLVAVARTK